MSEINFNTLSRSTGIDKPGNSAVGQKNVSNTAGSFEADSAQFSELPDLSGAEQNVEDEFAALRSRFEGVTNLDTYPPSEAVDQLAQMIARSMTGRK